MDKVKDIELVGFDLRIENGDFVINPSDEQHIEHLLLFDKGHIKHSPLTGVGIVKFLNSPDTVSNVQSMKNKIKIQLEYDGFVAVKLDETTGINNIKIDAKRQQ